MLFTDAKNPDNPIIFANDSLLALSGFARDELLGQDFRFLMAPGASAGTMSLVETAFRQSPQLDHTSAVDPEIHCCRKDGSKYWASLFISPVYDEDHIIVQYFASLINVSTYKELLETQARMQELQSEVFHMARITAMGEMAANLAHELNQPLSAIANYLKGSNRILDRMEGPLVEMLREAHNEAAGQARRAGNVIRHLREFVARGESERAIEDLRGLIEDATHLALLGAKDSGIKIAFDFAHRTPFALVNRTQIQQVLLNLIRNALEAMEHAGKNDLVIRTEELPLESMVQVSVVDTGPGIAPAVLDKLFKPFTTTKKSGMGIGLSICRTIIEAHGGKLWAESLSGAGSTFYFTLRTVEKDENPDDMDSQASREAEVQRGRAASVNDV